VCAELRIDHGDGRAVQRVRQVRAAARPRDGPLQIAAALEKRCETRDRVAAVPGAALRAIGALRI
jgi:hypothetical protein